MPNEPQPGPGAAPPEAGREVAARERRGAGRRAPQWRMIFTMGLFAATVYAATNGLLQLAVEAPRDANGQVIRAPAPEPESAPPASQPASGAGDAKGGAGDTPATAPAPAADGAPAVPPQPATPGAGGDAPPATRDPAAAPGASPEDTNEDESAAAGRRGAPPRPSEDEAPEYRESADNNISLPVDI